MLGMNELQVWALFFLVLGVFDLGLSAGEYRIIRQVKQRKNIDPEVPDGDWPVMGVIFCIVAIVLAIIAANPAEKLIERANQIRSSATAENPVR